MDILPAVVAILVVLTPAAVIVFLLPGRTINKAADLIVIVALVSVWSVLFIYVVVELVKRSM